MIFFFSKPIDESTRLTLIRRSTTKRLKIVFRKLYRLAAISRRLVFRIILLYTTHRVMFRKSNINVSAIILYYIIGMCAEIFSRRNILQRTVYKAKYYTIILYYVA